MLRSFVIAVLAIVIATFSTGIDSKRLKEQLTYMVSVIISTFWNNYATTSLFDWSLLLFGQMQFKKTEVESEDEVPYGYGFFHFVFAMGAMYFAMLFVSWNSQNTMPK